MNKVSRSSRRSGEFSRARIRPRSTAHAPGRSAPSPVAGGTRDDRSDGRGRSRAAGRRARGRGRTRRRRARHLGRPALADRQLRDSRRRPVVVPEGARSPTICAIATRHDSQGSRRGGQRQSRPPQRSSPRSTAKLQALPGEIDALRARGAEEIAAEEQRIAAHGRRRARPPARADAARNRSAAAAGQTRARRARRQSVGAARRRSIAAADHARGSGSPGRSLSRIR